MKLSGEELRAANLARCEVFGHRPDSWKAWQWATAMCGEVGEVLNEIKKLWRGDGSMERLGNELADVVIYGDFVLNACGVAEAERMGEWIDSSAAPRAGDEGPLVAGLMGAAESILNHTCIDTRLPLYHVRNLQTAINELAVFHGVPLASAIIRTFNAKSIEKGSAVMLRGEP